jgi:hypothetical protein
MKTHFRTDATDIVILESQSNFNVAITKTQDPYHMILFTCLANSARAACTLAVAQCKERAEIHERYLRIQSPGQHDAGEDWLEYVKKELLPGSA